MIRTLKIHILVSTMILAVMSTNLTAANMSPGAGGAADISNTPAYELLSALELLNISPREGLAVEEKTVRPDSSYVVRITLHSKEVPAPFAPAV